MTALTQIIKEKINESGQTVHQFAKQLGMSSSGLYRLLNRKDMPLSRFLHISRLLNYNLLTELYRVWRPMLLLTIHFKQKTNN